MELEQAPTTVLPLALAMDTLDLSEDTDTLSDSEWLTISSNRESDDTDSLYSGSRDSSDPGDEPQERYLPISRRSSISVSSVSSLEADGDVEAWEGLVDQDEPLLDHLNNLPELEATVSVNAAQAATVGASSDDSSSIPTADSHITAETLEEEEQRVKAALDQSMISTLSSSRSSQPSTAHNSIRDIRLSFPDPITSSRDDLNRSYSDVVSPSDSDESDLSSDSDGPDATQDVADPGLFPTPEVLHFEAGNRHEGDIVMYGFTGTAPVPKWKWSLVNTLLQKAATGAGAGTIIQLAPSRSPAGIASATARWLHQEKGPGGLTIWTNIINVHDMTYDMEDEDSPFKLSSESLHLSSDSERPSLAIVFLPSAFPSHCLPEHTYYLPVLAPSLVELTDVASQQAEDMWKSLGIPSEQTLRPNPQSAAFVVDVEELYDLEPIRAHTFFQRLFVEEEQRKKQSVLKRLVTGTSFNSIHAVTLLALVSIVFGCVMNTSFRASPPIQSTPTTAITNTPNQSWGVIGPVINQSASSTHNTNTNLALIPSSLKDFAIAVFNPPITSVSIIPSSPPAQKSIWSSASAPTHDSPTKSLTLTPSNLKDLMTVAVQSAVAAGRHMKLDADPRRTVVDAITKLQRPKEGTSVSGSGSSTLSSALSLRLVGSVSEIIDATMKAVVLVVRQDLQELMEALDDLMRAIGHQTATIVEQSKGTSQALRQRLRYRNDRAKGKARELRTRGKEFIDFAGEKVRQRAERAKQKARTIRERMASRAIKAKEAMNLDMNALAKGAEGGLRRARRKMRAKRRRAAKLFSRI